MLGKLLAGVSVSVLAIIVGYKLMPGGQPSLYDKYRFEISAAIEREAAGRTAPEGQPAPRGYEHFVSSDGSDRGDGSMEHPWDLATALSHPPAVKPGDIIWLRGGEYVGKFRSTLSGLQLAPIVVRQYPGERARISGCVSAPSTSEPILNIEGGAVWFWGFEITDCMQRRQSEVSGSSPEDIPYGPAVRMIGADTKVINLIIHDTFEGIDSWSEARRAEAYGNIVYYNGWDGPDRGHGHGIYIQNELGTKKVLGNIIFNQFRHGIHAYTANGKIDNLDIESNIVFMNGAVSKRSGPTRNILVGGEQVAHNVTLVRNLAYYPLNGIGENNLGYLAGCQDVKLLSNYLIGPTTLRVVSCAPIQMRDNVFIGKVEGFEPNDAPMNTYSEQPSTPEVVIFPNGWEVGRASVAVLNWGLERTVDLDVSRLGLEVGDTYELRNVQDYFSDVIRGVYDGGPVQIPMTGRSVAEPVGAAPPPSTFPEFGVFEFTSAGG